MEYLSRLKPNRFQTALLYDAKQPALKIIAASVASAIHRLTRLADGEAVVGVALGVVVVDDAHFGLHGGGGVREVGRDVVPMAALDVDDGKHFGAEVDADAEALRRGLQAVAAVGEKAAVAAVGIAVKLDVDGFGVGKEGSKQALKQRGAVHAFAEHAVEVGEPAGVFVDVEAEGVQDSFQPLRRTGGNQADKFLAHQRQLLKQHLVQPVNKVVAAVVGVAQNAQQLEFEHAQERIGQLQTALGQREQAVAGFFIAALVAAEPAFKVELFAAVALGKGEGVEIMVFEVVFDVDALRAAFARLGKQGQRPAVDVAVL